MNAFNTKTLLYILISFLFITSSCSTSSKTFSDHTRNNTHKSSKKSSKNYAHNKPSKKSPNSGKTKRVPSLNSKTNVPAYSTAENQIRSEIINYASTLKGIPYKYGGKDQHGFDCSGFVSHVFTSQNISIKGNSNVQAQLGKKVNLQEASKGDLIFFGSGDKISHVGIIVECSSQKLVVIHSTSSRGVVKEDIIDSTYWKPRILYVRNVISYSSVAE